jgi:hypothetical protein
MSFWSTTKFAMAAYDHSMKTMFRIHRFWGDTSDSQAAA